MPEAPEIRIMSDFINNPVNKRFREVYKALDSNNLIKGKSDIARELGTYNHVINSILKGKRNITVDQLNKLFDISPYHPIATRLSHSRQFAYPL